MRLIVRPEAEADIDDAYAWYESQQSGLGQRFLAEMSRCIADIERVSTVTGFSPGVAFQISPPG